MKKKSKLLSFMIIVMLFIIIAVCVVVIIIHNNNEKISNNEYNKLASSYANISSVQDDITAPSINEKKATNPINFTALQKQNSEIYSWIYIPNTNINYPVCQSTVDDNYYLSNSIYKSYSFSGAIYSQMCNTTTFSDPVTVLYGHNMANGSMFADLHKFENTDFFNKNKYIYIYMPYHKLKYEVVSSFIYDDRHILNTFDFSKKSEIDKYFKIILNPHSLEQNVRKNVSLSSNDKVLTLSTCLNSGEGRYLVQGVLISDELTE